MNWLEVIGAAALMALGLAAGGILTYKEPCRVAYEHRQYSPTEATEVAVIDCSQ